MKRIFSFLILCLLSQYLKAQYFVPVFDSKLSRAQHCEGFVADSAHHILYVTAHYNSGLPTRDTSWLYSYKAGKLTQVGPTENFEDYLFGTCTSSGKCMLLSEWDIDYTIYHTLDSLELTDCYLGTVCDDNGFVTCLKTVHDTVYVGGNLIGKFQNTNSYQIGGISPDGISFPLGEGVTEVGYGVFVLEYFKGELYAAGGFSEMDHVPVRCIARWNGSKWDSVGKGVTGNGGDVRAMREYDNKLYVNGSFDSAGGIFCKGSARWTGTNWETIPEFDNLMEGLFVHDMKVFHNKLYMTGDFWGKGNSYYTGMLEYDGKNLKHFDIANHLNSNPYPSRLEVFDDTLFIAGGFDSLSYIPAKYLVKFVDGTFSTYAPIGTKWWYNSSANGQQANNSCYKYYEVLRDTFVMNTPPTSGYNCRKIKAEQYLPNKTHSALQPLYVFGDTNRIMYYNNYQKRFVVGYRFNVTVGDTLTYYTPQPQNAGDTTFRVVVDSVTMLTVQTEKLKRVYTTPLDGWSFGNDGYAQLIGGLASMLPQPINYYSNEGPLLCYQDTSLYFKYFTGGVSCDVLTAIAREQKEKERFSIYPNPVTNKLKIKADNELIEQVQISNVLGQTMLATKLSQSKKETEIDVSNLPQGMYLLRVKTKEGWSMGKFVKE